MGNRVGESKTLPGFTLITVQSHCILNYQAEPNQPFGEWPSRLLLLLLVGGLLHDLKLKTKFLAAKNVGEVELPKLSREAHRGPMLVKVGDEFHSEKAPELGETYVSTHWPKFDHGIEREGCVIGHEAGKGIAVEMILMSRICGPIRIRIVGRDDFYQTRRLGYAMKLANKGHYVRHVFNNVTTDDLVKFVIRKRIGNRSEVVDNIRVGPWI